MEHSPQRQAAIILLTMLLVACLGPSVAPNKGQVPDKAKSLGKQQILDAAWEALEPNTTSHNRSNWEVAEARRVTGKEVSDEFESGPAPGCPGPTPTANKAVETSATYWYVHFKRRPATPLPQKGTIPPTAPPAVPEPFMYQAFFLVDPAEGQVVARKLYCVIY